MRRRRPTGNCRNKHIPSNRRKKKEGEGSLGMPRKAGGMRAHRRPRGMLFVLLFCQFWQSKSASSASVSKQKKRQAKAARALHNRRASRVALDFCRRSSLLEMKKGFHI